MAGTTPNIGLNIPDHGDQNWDVPVNQNWNTLDTAIAGKQATLTFDSTPTSGSSNPVTSGGIYSAIQAATPAVDNKSVDYNGNSQLEAVGVISARDNTTAIKLYPCTKAQYTAITTKDPNTLYNITDDTDVNLAILEALYPVGSIYETTNVTCPLTSLISGSTWVEETSRVLVEKKVATSNDPTWYNLYSDGWCEQGGIVNYTSDSLTTVNLSKTYTDTDYCVQVTVAIVGSAAVNDSLNAQRFSASNVTVSSFQVRGNGTNTYNRQSWFACGYTSTTTTHKRFRRTA